MQSIWNDNCTIKRRKALSQDISTNHLIVGAGMAGILIGYFLKKYDNSVVIIDANEIASGDTEHTTAKITSQHGLIYHKLISEFGEKKAKQYAMANELAIKQYKQLIENRKIDCDFEEKTSYLYSLDKTEQLKQEVDAANKLGIPAELVQTTELPFEVKGAVKVPNQAQFHPLKFLKNLQEELVIYENTKALEFIGNVVLTNHGRITAKNIIVATHYPIIDIPGFYFTKMHQERSYVLALENVKRLDGMYRDIAKDGYSFRMYHDLLLFGGLNQRTGANEHGGCYDTLRKEAKKLYPEAKERYHWSAQDCITIDGIPYIGKYSKKTPNMYVATGFNKWGMTNSMVAAMILSDMIMGRDNQFAEIFSPRRFDLSASIRTLTKDLATTTKNYTMQKVYIPRNGIETIQNGHGGIVEYNGKKVGVYKNEEGECFIVSTKCPHLGCQLHWNADELTWDCPCHGSRFDYRGNPLEDPAIQGLLNH